MKKYTYPLKVRSYELDSQGHVNYAVYLSYLEYARVTAMEDLNIPFQDYIKKGQFIVIAEIHMKYLKPLKMGDEVDITLEGIKPGRTHLTFKQEIFQKDGGDKVLEAELVAVFVDRAGRPRPMDEDFRRAFIDDK